MEGKYAEELIILALLLALAFSSTFLTSENFEITINYGEVYITQKGEFIFSKRIIGFPNVKKGVEVVAKSRNNRTKNVSIVFEYEGKIENASKKIFFNGSLLIWNETFNPYEKKRLIIVGEINLSKPRVYSYFYIPAKKEKKVKKIIIEEEKEPVVIIERKTHLPARYGEKAKEILEPNYEIKRGVKIDFPTFLAFLLGVFFLTIVSTLTTLGKREERKKPRRYPRLFIKTEYPEDYELSKKLQ